MFFKCGVIFMCSKIKILLYYGFLFRKVESLIISLFIIVS